LPAAGVLRKLPASSPMKLILKCLRLLDSTTPLLKVSGAKQTIISLFYNLI
jgi:hypothetical protein